MNARIETLCLIYFSCARVDLVYAMYNVLFQRFYYGNSISFSLKIVITSSSYR